MAGLTQKVIRLLDHPAWCDNVGKQNRKKIERFFGAERYRQQLETVFRCDGGISGSQHHCGNNG
ncbi:hypothetical protein JIR001_17150 [Polycladomyces abyssicola]|uniref:Uncharacterized protein n=1 Tax=Polycladomyces abyssicola TaxID=1125966 RepID=A0A8D5ZNG9_9BACL|nr:hypothetical protein JIR001_17150 [Polycladomyces abyssicola]